MSEFKVNTITNRDGSYGPQVCGITTFGSSGMQLPSGPTEFRGGRGRGVFGGGYNPTMNNVLNFVEIASTGDATDFGDLTQGREMGAGFGSATRGVFMGGRLSPDAVTTIDYVTLSSGGGADDFGNMENSTTFFEGCSNQVRGVGMLSLLHISEPTRPERIA